MGMPSRSTRSRESRSCHGHVRTIAASRSPASSSSSLSGAIGSKNRRRSPSSIAYDETSGPHGSPASHCGCGACQCQRPGCSSRISGILDAERESRQPPLHRLVELRLVGLPGLLAHRRCEAVAKLRKAIGARLDEIEIVAVLLLRLVAV